MPKTNRPAMVLVPARFSPAAAEWIEAHASDEGVSDSEILRRAVWFYRHYVERGAAGRPETSQTEKT